MDEKGSAIASSVVCETDGTEEDDIGANTLDEFDEPRRTLSKPQMFSSDEPLPECTSCELDGKEVIADCTTSKSIDDSWLLGGPLGSRNAVLVFKCCALTNPTEMSIQSKPAYKLHVTYKVLQAETKLLSKLLDCHGISEVNLASPDFNILWTGSHPKPGILRAMASHQRVNHFPRSYELTRKDRLYKNIERMQHSKGYKHFDFIPQTYLMPLEYRDLCTAHHRLKGPWIVKPVASSRGRGILIVETPTQVPLEEPVVVAKYISNPLLVSGHKCDLRLYVAVTCFDPLLVYIYEEGLVRFATVKYDASHKQLWNPCMHLCNYSINKYHSDYVKSDDPSAENVGHKWTLSALLRHLKGEGKDTSMLMSQIEDMIIKSIIASANSIVSACKMFMPYMGNCFELYGFDILVDADLKPWLLEINLSPSLGCDSPLDVRLKSAMLVDLLNLVGVPAVDPMLRPSLTSLASVSRASNNSNLRMKLGNCRRILSNDGMNGKKSHQSGTRPITPQIGSLSPEELRVLKAARSQFERRGGFVRIFPAADTWAKYSQYLDSTTGIPLSGNSACSSMASFTVGPNPHNFNLLLQTYLFPEVNLSTDNSCTNTVVVPLVEKNTNTDLDAEECTKLNEQCSGATRASNAFNGILSVGADGAGCGVGGGGGGENTGQLDRQTCYERMLKQGHKESLFTSPFCNASCEDYMEATTTECQLDGDLRRKIFELLSNGKKLTQYQTRKTFIQYLTYGLKRVTNMGATHSEYVDIVLKFLLKASSYLRTPYIIQNPSDTCSLQRKHLTAIVAKQLSDFLYLYNRETELFVEKTERGAVDQYFIALPLYMEFLVVAKESDLERILMHQTLGSIPAPSCDLLAVSQTNQPKNSSSAGGAAGSAQTEVDNRKNDVSLNITRNKIIGFQGVLRSMLNASKAGNCSLNRTPANLLKGCTTTTAAAATAAANSLVKSKVASG